MKKFNYFLLIVFTLLFTTFESKAFTTTFKNQLSTQQTDYSNSELQKQISNHLPFFNNTFELKELNFTSSESVSFLERNLTILYSICVALVLFNLVAQVKIIYQMIHLFFLFKKKDEFTAFEF